LAAGRLLLRTDRPAAGERPLAFAALASVILLAFAFKSFYRYYIVAALPLITACTVIEFERFIRLKGTATFRLWNPAVISLASLAACLGYVEVYYRLAESHGVTPARIVNLLRTTPGPIYTMVPDFVLWNRQRLPDWYYKIDSYLPRVTGALGDPDFERMLAGVTAVVISPDEFDDYPHTAALLRREFRREYADQQWEVWLREEGKPMGPEDQMRRGFSPSMR
jgi:hypothetical protein